MIVPNVVKPCDDAIHRAELAILRRLRAVLQSGGRLADLDTDVDAYERFWQQISDGITADQLAATAADREVA